MLYEKMVTTSSIINLVATAIIDANDKVINVQGEGVVGEGRCGDRLSLRDREVDREEGCQEILDGSWLIGSDGS